ncbi:DUF3375 family protein [Megasphaera elsdenii]
MKRPEEYFLDQRLNAPGIRLLNSRYYPFIMSFLYKVFHKEPQKSIPDEEMQIQLQEYIQDVREAYSAEEGSSQDDRRFLIPQKEPGELLKYWCDDNQQWLLHTSKSYSLTSVVLQVFDFTKNSTKPFNSYRTESILRDVIDRTHELASYVNPNKNERIKFHQYKIKQLKGEIQRHEEAINKIRQEGTVTLYTDEKTRNIRQYLEGQLQDLRMELSLYKLKIETITNQFFQEAAAIQREEDDGIVIRNFIDRLDTIEHNEEFRNIHEIQALMDDDKITLQLDRDTETINEYIGKKPFGRKRLSIAARIRDACLVMNKQMDGFRVVHGKIINMLTKVNLEEQRHVDRVLQHLVCLGRALKDANSSDGPKTLMVRGRAEFPMAGITRCNLRLDIRQSSSRCLQSIQKGKVPEHHSEPRPIIPEIPYKELLRRVEEFREKQAVVRLTDIAERYPITRGFNEVRSYMQIFAKYHQTPDPKNQYGILRTYDKETDSRKILIWQHPVIIQGKGRDQE